MDNQDRKKHDPIEKVLDIASSLNGLGALFQSKRDFDFSEEELFGIGTLIKGKSKELFDLEDGLRGL